MGAPAANPVTSIPNTLVANTYLKAADAQLTRQLTISDSSGFPNILGPNAFLINRILYKLNYNEYNVPLNNTEIWQITSSSILGHPFHIHDVEFKIISTFLNIFKENNFYFFYFYLIMLENLFEFTN